MRFRIAPSSNRHARDSSMPMTASIRATATLPAALLLLALAALALLPRPARAENVACTALDTMPVTISAPGNYCLQRDFSAGFNTSETLRIIADDVVLDCNHHRLVNTNAANTTAAILVSGDHRNVTIRNCQVDGFYVGILVQGVANGASFGHVVEDNIVLRSRSNGITVAGSSLRVERNRVSGTTGNYNGVAKGIYISSGESEGVGNLVRDNIISDFRPTPPGGGSSYVTGLTVINIHDSVVSGNVVTGLYTTAGQGVYGIIGSNTTGTVYSENTVTAPPPLPAPLDGGHWGGIRIEGGTVEQQASNLCRGNVVGHFGINFLGCTQVDNTSL